MSALAGLPIGIAAEWLRATGCEPWWFARSMFLCHGCDSAVPQLGFASAAGDVREVTRTPGAAVVFGFRSDAGMRAWAKVNRAAVAMPAPQIVAAVGDKTRLPEFADAAGVATPRCVIRRGAGVRDAGALWRELGVSPAVLQRAENDLTGTGTYRVAGPDEIAGRLAVWGRCDVKLATYVEGLPVTVSAVAGRQGTVVSGLSMQLVGYPELTPVWGAHCGNQLVDDSRLPSGAAGECRAVARRLGAVLRAEGFHGMFGLDLIVGPETVYVIEINPRVQSVSSLLNSAELAAGLLPSPLLHLLDFLAADEPGEVIASDAPLPAYGQLVVTALWPGQVAAAPSAGVYRLGGAAGTAARTGAAPPLGALAADQAVVWPFAAPGDRVRPGDRLAVLQTAVPVADPGDGALTATARAWLAELSGYTQVAPIEGDVA